MNLLGDGRRRNGVRRLQFSTAPCNPQAEKAQKALLGILQEMRVDSRIKKAELLRWRITEQWKLVAIMYDRISFAVFVIVVLAITTWFVTLAPNNDRGEEAVR